MKTRVIAWWSGGITSAYACLLACWIYDNVEVVFIDTRNESEDTERFLKDCERLYGKEIIRTSNPKYKNIREVWRKYNSLNNAHGAICSTELKREVRESYQNLETDYAQIFGFDTTEPNRHANMRRNYPELNVKSPLITAGMTKPEAIAIFLGLGIIPPKMYEEFENNNCDGTGCVRGGIGYWQKRKVKRNESFIEMALMEHELTDKKGEPVTIIRDQTKARKGEPIFLLPHPNYPQYQDISMKKGIAPESLMECTGFCSTEN